MLAPSHERQNQGKYPPSDAHLITLFCEGNEWAATVIHKRYEKRVRHLAERNWPAAVRSRFDPDDIVQEVFDRFFRAVRRGLYSTNEESPLWGFFLVITLNQVRRTASRHLARRRDVRQTVLQGNHCTPLEFQERRQSCVAHSELVVEETLAALPLPMRHVVECKLQGYTVVEIARSLMISHRTVERLLQAVRLRIAELFEQAPDAAPAGRIRIRKGTERSQLHEPASAPATRCIRIA